VVDQYLAFLKSGCTEDPVSLLKKAGVDLSTGRPVDEALAVFEDAIRQMEELDERED
jgi:oligoendopeptidase F